MIRLNLILMDKIKALHTFILVEHPVHPEMHHITELKWVVNAI